LIKKCKSCPQISVLGNILKIKSMISLLENMGVLVIPNSSVAAKAPTERERERERG
jgi:hypothetical protein